MDPVSLIEAALVAGAAASAKDTTSQAVKDAYTGLKRVLNRLFAEKPQAILDGHETDPQTYEKPLKKLLTEAHADQDADLLAAAEQVTQYFGSTGSEPASPTQPEHAWLVPYRRNPFFTGREDVLNRLHEHFTRAKQDQHIIVAAVQHWLTTHDQWLLILDNADDAALSSEFLPTGDSGHILLTTREPAWGSVAHSFEVEKMSQTEGVLFLLRRAKALWSPDAPLSQASRSDQMTAAAIVREFDGLPLALDQAGAYIEEKKSTLSAYLNAYTRRRADLLGQRGRTPMGYPASVATTWSLAFEQVEQHDPPATDLLRFLAFLAPDAIPEDLIIKGATELGPHLKAFATDETLFDEAVGLLLRFSLVQRSTDQHLLLIHRLVQAILRAKITDEMQQEWAERTTRAVNLAFPDVTDVTLWEQCERYLPHALVCARLIEAYSFTFAEASYLLNQTACYLYERAQYPQAEPLYQRALATREQQLGPQHPHTATSGSTGN